MEDDRDMSEASLPGRPPRRISDAKIRVLVNELSSLIKQAHLSRTAFIDYVNTRQQGVRLTRDGVSRQLGDLDRKPFGPDWDFVLIVVDWCVPAAEHRSRSQDLGCDVGDTATDQERHREAKQERDHALARLAGLWCVARSASWPPGYTGQILWPDTDELENPPERVDPREQMNQTAREMAELQQKIEHASKQARSAARDLDRTRREYQRVKQQRTEEMNARIRAEREADQLERNISQLQLHVLEGQRKTDALQDEVRIRDLLLDRLIAASFSAGIRAQVREAYHAAITVYSGSDADSSASFEDILRRLMQPPNAIIPPERIFPEEANNPGNRGNAPNNLPVPHRRQLPEPAKNRSPSTSAEGAKFNFPEVIKAPRAIKAVEFSPDGTRLALACRGKTAMIVDLTGAEQYRLRHDGWITSVRDISYAPDGRRLATVAGSHAQIWDADTGAELLRLPHPDPMGGVAFSPDGRRLATAGGKNAWVWDAATGAELLRIPHIELRGKAMFSPDGRRLATAGGKNAWVWDAATGAELLRIPHPGSVRDMAFSPDGQRLATADGGSAWVWDAATGAEILRIPHGHVMGGVTFSPDGQILVTISNAHIPIGTISGAPPLERSDKSVWVWDAATGAELLRISHALWVNRVVFSPDGQFLAIAADGRTVQLRHLYQEGLSAKV
ncbi:hypothetical protein [Streptosporangium saharense]|uniref:hypothetical protein n=1 Tax=Streptosporangium saharense TaxID=1706840 RepID=UPI0033332C59